MVDEFALPAAVTRPARPRTTARRHQSWLDQRDSPYRRHEEPCSPANKGVPTSRRGTSPRQVRTWPVRESELTIDAGQLHHGYHAVVVPVSGDGAKWVLKLAWPPSSIVDESIALRSWNGRGVAQLGRADLERGVLLLERLDADYSLSDLPLIDAALQAASLLGEMSVPAPAAIRSGREDIETMRQTMHARRGVVDARQRHWVDGALSLLDSLATGVAATLVHGDLHYENVLRGERRPWLAIDPKPVASDPERGLAELLLTRVDELSNDAAIRDLLGLIVEAGHLRSDRAEVWAFVRTVDYWLWAVAHGLTVDPARCERVVLALQPLLR